MDYEIREIREYYDSEIRDYDFNELVRIGVSRENADFMTDIGVPEEIDGFVFFEFSDFEKLSIDEVQFIKIGYHSSYGIFLKEGSDELFTSSSIHRPYMYVLNRNIRTFLLFQLIRHEISARMRSEGVYTPNKYAIELRKVFEQFDAVSMRDTEGYWSHLLEDYETGL